MVKTYGKFVSKNGTVVELGNNKLREFKSRLVNKNIENELDR